MMFWIWMVLSIGSLLEAAYTTMKAFRYRRFFCGKLMEPLQHSGVWPKVALLAPCKGTDPNFRENVASWARLDYPHYHIFFIVESETDPALEILQDYPKATLLVAGEAVDCGQKVHNLRYAIERLPQEFEVLAFVDSDCKLRQDWLRALISSLIRNPEGAVTGYRWFLARTGHFATRLRAVWNSSVLTLFEESGRLNFAWGGSMAILRKTFQEAHVLDFWKGSISDDYGLTNAMRAGGRKIHFVPQALVVTDEPASVGQFYSWASRQFLITRIYNPGLWWLAFLGHVGWFLWVVTGCLFYPGSFLLLFLVFESAQVIKAEIRLGYAHRALGVSSTGDRLYFWLLSPLIAFCNFFLLCGTLFSTKIRWRGIEYVVHDPHRVELRRENHLLTP